MLSPLLVPLVLAVGMTMDTSQVLYSLRYEVANVLNITRACVAVRSLECLSRPPEERRYVDVNDDELEEYTQETLVQRHLIQQRQ